MAIIEQKHLDEAEKNARAKSEAKQTSTSGSVEQRAAIKSRDKVPSRPKKGRHRMDKIV